MNLIDQTIRRRRSIYPNQFVGGDIGKEEVLALLELANCAPTHKKTEPWRFKVYHSESARRELGAFLGNAYMQDNNLSEMDLKASKIIQKPLKSACVIAICMYRAEDAPVPEWEDVAAVAMAVQNLWLACESRGLGGYWSSIRYILDAKEWLGLGEGERCLGLFYLGKVDALSSVSTRGDVRDKTVFL